MCRGGDGEGTCSQAFVHKRSWRTRDLMDGDWNFKSPIAASSAVRWWQRNVSAQELKSLRQCIGWFLAVSPAAGLALCPGRRKVLPCNPVFILPGGWGEASHLAKS